MPNSYLDTHQAGEEGVYEYETQLHYEGGFYNGEAHLDNNTWRLWKVPQWKAKKTHEGRLGLVCLRAASAEDAAPCRVTGEVNLHPRGNEPDGTVLSSWAGRAPQPVHVSLEETLFLMPTETSPNRLTDCNTHETARFSPVNTSSQTNTKVCFTSQMDIRLEEKKKHCCDSYLQTPGHSPPGLSCPESRAAKHSGQ